MPQSHAEPNEYPKRRSERNVQRRSGASVPSSAKEGEEQLAKEDADLIERVKALKESGRAPAVVAKAARQVEEDVSNGPERRKARPAGTPASAAGHQSKTRSAYAESYEQPVRESWRNPHGGQEDRELPRRTLETPRQRSLAPPPYYPASPSPQQASPTAADEDELPPSTIPDSPSPEAASTVTIRRYASRERLEKLRELSRVGSAGREQVSPSGDTASETAFGESSWASLKALVLWQNASQSSLVFGGGTFFILASSGMQEWTTRPLSVAAYSLLLYTAANFVLTFSRRHGPSPALTPVTEASVLPAVRLLLPFLTATKAVHARLFNGDTTTTLQVAVVLWFLAQCGRFITFWDVVRIAFFGVFLLPRVYVAYADHIRAAGRSLYARCRRLVLSFPHKRKVAALVALTAWHSLALPTKCFLGFVLLVLLRRYQEGHAQQVDAGVSFVRKQAKRLSSSTPVRKHTTHRATLEEID